MRNRSKTGIVKKTKDYWLSIKETPLNVALWMDLLKFYASHEQHWQAIHVAKNIERLNSQLRVDISRILKPIDWQAGNAGDGVLGSPVVDHAAELTQKFRKWLKSNPRDWLALLYLARLKDFELDASSGLSAPENPYELAKSIEYIEGESAHLLGRWRLQAGDAQGAVSVLTPLIYVHPIRYGSMMYLGEALIRTGNVAAAEKAFERASHSNNARFLVSLADKVYKQNYWEEGIKVLQKAVSIDPTSQEAWFNLALMQSEVYQLSECQNSLNQLKMIHADPQLCSAVEECISAKCGDSKKHFEMLLSRDGKSTEDSRWVSAFLMTSLYQDGLTAEYVADLHKDRCSKIELNIPQRKFTPRSSEQKRLRVGYVTGDLHRQHPVNIFMLPLLREQAKSSALEVFIYHTGVMHDVYTAQAKLCADRWVEANGMDDFQLHQLIVDDQVDVLIDLAGHTSSHRLGVFLQRSAPVQATYLGYPHSTGLACMDYLIGDQIVSPVSDDYLFSEKVMRISNASVFCWAPVDYYPVPKNRPDSGPVVFGSFNNAMKLSSGTLKLWAEILKAVPESKILLKAPSFRDAGVCARFLDAFTAHGVSAEHVEFRGPSELTQMMHEYGDIDIALDPLTYNGGTTSLQALWMGVPLITMRGSSFQSRMGASFLTMLEKTEWIASDEATYIDIANRMANSISEVRGARQQNRKAMADSALCDIGAFANEFEGLLFQMYRDKCLGEH
jgi:protein O-GlcNAc transferase